MVSRRTGALLVCVGLALLATALAAGAQPRPTKSRIGMLWLTSIWAGPIEAFRQGLRNLGYVEGQHLTIEH